jgi:prolyl-tRNA synthetase
MLEAYMKYSNLFIPTLREAPADVTAVSHLLMLRAGYVRQLAAGLYIYLPLGWRVLTNINRILKEEMDAIGAQEVSLPVLHPAEIWSQTGRWQTIGDEMFRLKDRNKRDMCLGMTHEEIMTWLASREIKSYKELPQIWYQIQTKLRDEARPRGGVLRTREFLMKDSYSFDADEEGLEHSYQLHANAYHKIYNRCGLKFYQVESDPGMMGGSTAHEFMAPTPAGEDEIVICDSCGYTANVEIAVSAAPANDSVASGQSAIEDVATPEKRTVAEVSAFLRSTPSNFVKSILVIADSTPVLALVRGDQEIHEKKLTKIIGEFRHATKDEALTILKVEVGFIGPMGHDIRMIADDSLKSGVYISGANKPGYHTKGIKPGIDFKPEWADIRMAKSDDFCVKCGGRLHSEKVIEIGNIFRLGTKYSVALGANYLDKNGQESPIVMGSYGIGPARIAASAIEQNNDKDGIIWPKTIAPFDIHIMPLNLSDQRTVELAGALYDALISKFNMSEKRLFDVLFDDRDIRPGVKFKDADLIGTPLQVIIGEKNLKNNQIEIKIRRTAETRKIYVENAVDEIVSIYSEI